MTLGVDVGGTFTDLAWWDGERLRTAKTSSTPDQSEGVLSGAAGLLDGASVDRFLHGTTVATNALLERDGARTVLVTDEGTADVLAIGRQDRPSLYDVEIVRPDPVVPHHLTLEAAGRPTKDAARPLSQSELTSLRAEVAAMAPEAIAVVSLFSFLHPSRERSIAACLDLGVPVSLSSVVAPEFREFERTSTTTLNAYLSPKMARYLARLGGRAADAGLPSAIQVMRSSGGLMSIEAAAHLPAAALLSGPAGGVVATAALGAALGDDRMIAFDMGGTSTDVCRIEGGAPEVSFERQVGGLVCRMPSVAVHTVGAGGGSIGWRDPGGALRVGPRSAGAVPGPACYDRGGVEPTVTDANVHLGRIDSHTRLAGSVVLHRGRADAALARLGAALGFTTSEVALGILTVVEAHMERAVRAVSVEEGADPRPARLVAFGGAGGLHATALARRLEMRGVVVPPHAGVFSALGLLLSPPRHDASRSLPVGEQTFALVGAAINAVAATASQGLREMGEAVVSMLRTVDVRYRGQAHETSVLFDGLASWDELAQRFHRIHAERNGFARPGDPIEAMTVRASALGRPALAWGDLQITAPEGEAERGRRKVRFSEGSLEARVVWRPGLHPGDTVLGPAVIEEPQATTLIGPGESASVHESGALEVSW